MDPVTLGVVVVVVPLVLAWLARQGALASAKPGELRYSRKLRWFAVLMAILPPVGFSALLLVVKRPEGLEERLAFLGVLLFFPAIAVPLALEFLRVRHAFDETGIWIRTPWRKDRRLSWSNVSWVKWRSMAKWLDLKTHDGVTLHISPWLSGLQPFAEIALSRIPPEVLSVHLEGRAVLQLMLSGRAGALMTDPTPPEQLLYGITRSG